VMVAEPPHIMFRSITEVKRIPARGRLRQRPADWRASITEPAGRRLDREADICAGLLHMQITAHASSSSCTFASFSSIGASHDLADSSRIDVAYHTRICDKILTASSVRFIVYMLSPINWACKCCGLRQIWQDAYAPSGSG